MSQVITAVRGIALSGVLLVTIGTLTTVGATIHNWPSSDPDPTARARHLGQSISYGMRVTLLASAFVVPVTIVWPFRRGRREKPKS